VLDDGQPLAESNAILWYLAEGSELLPGDRLERARASCNGCSSSSTATSLTSPSSASGPCSPRTRPADGEIEARRAGRVQGAGRLWSAISRLAPTSSASRFTIADIGLYAYSHVAHEAGFEMSRYGAIDAWLRRVAAQPGHIPITA